MSDKDKKTESQGEALKQELTDEQLEQAAGGAADSFFDIFVEVDIPAAQSDRDRQPGELATADPASEIKRRG